MPNQSDNPHSLPLIPPSTSKNPPPTLALISPSASEAQPKHSLILPEKTGLKAEGYSVIGGFDEKNERALVYLSQAVIVMAGLQGWVKLEAGWFNAKKILILAVDYIQKLETPKSPETNVVPLQAALVTKPLEQKSLLESIVTSTRGALEGAIKYFDERSEQPGEEPAFLDDLSERAIIRENMRWSLLHGTQCELWKKEKLIASGRLQFYTFWPFSIGQGPGKKVFQIRDTYVTSGKYYIKKAESGKKKLEAAEEEYVEVNKV